MREIKFRAKDSHNIWRYGCIVKFDGLNPAIYFPIRRKDNSSVIATDWVTVKEDTIGQFTGLYDKNGSEIYEGDIVHLDTWKPDALQIKFIEAAFCLAFADGTFAGDIHYVHHARVNQCTVIGNIHDNPELLKGE